MIALLFAGAVVYVLLTALTLALCMVAADE